MAYAASYVDSDLVGLEYCEEATISAATALYTPASATKGPLYAKDITAEVSAHMIDVAPQKPQMNRGPNASIVGAKGGKIGFKLPLRGGQIAAGTRGTSPIYSLGKYSGFTRKSITASANNSIVTGGTSSTVTMLDADAAQYEVGDFILVNCNEAVSGVLQLRYITKMVANAGTTTISVHPNFATNPTSLDSTFSLDILTPAATNAGQIIDGSTNKFFGFKYYKGYGALNRSMLWGLGGAGTFKFDAVKAGEIPYASFEYMVDSWSSSAAADMTTSADAFYTPPLWVSDDFYIGEVAVDVEEFSFDPGHQLVPIAGQGPNGRHSWFYKDMKPKLSFKPYWDEQYVTDWLAGTQSQVFIQRVASNSNAWGICIPSVQFEKVKHGAVSGGMLGADLDIRITDPGSNDEVSPAQFPLFSICFTGA